MGLTLCAWCMGRFGDVPGVPISHQPPSLARDEKSWESLELFLLLGPCQEFSEYARSFATTQNTTAMPCLCPDVTAVTGCPCFCPQLSPQGSRCLKPLVKRCPEIQAGHCSFKPFLHKSKPWTCSYDSQEEKPQAVPTGAGESGAGDVQL